MKTILIIEDDDFFRELIRKKLTSKDFSFLEAVNGETGIEMMKEKKPDLVLLDLLLPNIDGFEVVTQIKSDPEISNIPIIVLSNLGQKEDIDRALKLGASDYLIKSQFDIDQVIEKITNVLQSVPEKPQTSAPGLEPENPPQE